MGRYLNLAKRFRRYLNFSAPKSGVFLDKSYRELTYLKWHQKEDFWMLFCNFLEINTHNFVKNDLKFESKSLFDAKFYGVYMKKILNPKSMIFGIWGLKTRLGQFGPKAFVK